jgi:hypothetical protein
MKKITIFVTFYWIIIYLFIVHAKIHHHPTPTPAGRDMSAHSDALACSDAPASNDVTLVAMRPMELICP